MENKTYVHLGEGTEIVFRIGRLQTNKNNLISENINKALEKLYVILKEKDIEQKDI